MLTEIRQYIQDYLAGACLANAPVLILVFIISLVYDDITNLHFKLFNTFTSLSTLISIFMFFSVLFAGFVIAGKASKQYILTGLLTGGFAFLLHFINKIVFYPANVTAGLRSLLSNILAGSFGGILQKIQKNR